MALTSEGKKGTYWRELRQDQAARVAAEPSWQQGAGAVGRAIERGEGGGRSENDHRVGVLDQRSHHQRHPVGLQGKQGQLVELYLQEIETLNLLLRAVIEVNPDALDQADKADRKRKRRGKNKGPLGGLQGIPILLKDTIATKDKLNTTAGSFALLGSVVPRDAGVVKKLRRSGAVILGKASLSEWYHFRSLNIPDGWSARGGQGKNPYTLTGNPCGSSSGSAIAVAANMVAVSLGTETDGSIICPASYNSVVGIKPTVGLTSRAGVVPISPRQDTIG
ncbi:hypothetical protein HHK36_032449 [Tetracentron sinense]|uniref:Amidase domain-containing protein n=1 Tax=Tetracentron sinense TaxID=13715 RepID=A0A834Y7W5_TETSI|nr:hypothetical protein HHK36_032449 [Tetracentron sinense]